MRLFAGLLATLLFLAAVPARAENTENGVQMVVLSVGKGDCILLKLGSACYLVDTGFKRTADQMMAMLAHEGVSRLNGVFLTHNHKDHYGGLKTLSKSNIPIDAFYTSAYCVDGINGDHPAVDAAARRGMTVQLLKSGDKVPVSDDVCFEVLGPTKLSNDNENNNSLVMRLTTPDGSILLTGDMKHEEEYQLISQSLLSAADVLKVAFHGDNTSTSTSFLDIVKPRAAIISTSSQEEPDTPAKDTLRRLASIGCPVYVTQNAVSAIRVTLSGGAITVAMEDWTE